MALDLGWPHIYHKGDVAFAKTLGIALDAPDERTGIGPHDDEDDDDDPLFINAVRLRNFGF